MIKIFKCYKAKKHFLKSLSNAFLISDFPKNIFLLKTLRIKTLSKTYTKSAFESDSKKHF